jgi:acetylornithine deacetylase/succinyl-diaminopimelate desuccinylase-like protein
VIGLDAPATGVAPNALVPLAKAKLSLRIAPSEDPKAAYAALRAHLERNVPWGAHVSVTLESMGAGIALNSGSRGYDAARAAFTTAWNGVEPVEMGIGGSIPFINTFLEMFPNSSVLVTGVEDPDGRAHGPNESLHLGEFERVCVAETLLLHEVARMLER